MAVRSTAMQRFYAALLIPGFNGSFKYCRVWCNDCNVISSRCVHNYAIRLYIKCDQTAARKLMFSSFFYLPIVLLALIIDKL